MLSEFTWHLKYFCCTVLYCNRHDLSGADCLEDKRKDYHHCSVLYCGPCHSSLKNCTRPLHYIQKGKRLTNKILNCRQSYRQMTTKLDARQCTASWPPIRWVRSGPVFRRLWTKVHQIKFACAGVFTVSNTIFRLTMSSCVPEIFANKSKSRSCVKSRQNLDVFRPSNLGGKGPPKFLTKFYKSRSPSNM